MQIMDTEESPPQRGRPSLPGKPHEELVVSHQIQDPSPAGRGNGFQASFSLKIVVFSLSMAIMAVALDATSLSVALPVRFSFILLRRTLYLIWTDPSS